jgi:predicted O-linked N-acetylglucosamine transferase (SPINDLY family)
MHADAVQIFQKATSLHTAGRILEAQGFYRQLLALEPDHAEALHMIGVALHQTGNSAEALEFLRRAAIRTPQNAAVFCNLGSVLAATGCRDDAISAFDRAIILNPHFPEAFNNLGTALKQSGQLNGAVAAIERAIAIRPNYPEAHLNLAQAMLDQCRTWDAITSLQHAISLRANYAEAFNVLGTAMQSAGRFTESIAAYQRAIQIAPNLAEAYGNLGNTLGQVGRLPDAIASLRKAIELRPDVAEFRANLANVLRDQDDLDAALAEADTALALKPDMPVAHATKAGILKDRGRLEESIAAYRRAADASADPKIADSLLLTLHYHPDVDAKALFPEHIAWEKKFAEPFYSSWPAHPNDRSPDRPLRIGYVGDLSNSPIGRFLLPLLTHHDSSLYHSYSYADVLRPDTMTQALRAQSVEWRDVAGVSDEQLYDQIRSDQIDILVDLAMHGGRNRLLVFARKPAPVQVTYLAYVSTTGLRAIDYRLTDHQLDPNDEDQPYYAEKSIRLSKTYWCYQAPDIAPEVTALPALSNGYTTFGSMNRSAKVTPQAFETWCGVLQSVPDSRLILHWGEGSHRNEARRRLVDHNVDPARLEFIPSVPFIDYLRALSRFDIALDPFPYPGGTTSCDSLWMGVPVITLAGKTASSRGGVSILSNLNLPELIAHTPDEYVEIAISLAAELSRLQSLRSTMRQRMQSSPLMKAHQFARDVESAFRRMWRTWCERMESSSQ